MKSFEPAFKIPLKRCRPLLGTFVEITIFQESIPMDETLDDLFHLAFERIEHVETLMSFHDQESELSLLNRSKVGEWCDISRSLNEVLTFALELQIKSKHVFNVAIANPLVAWGILPGQSILSFDHLDTPGFELLKNRARRLLPVRIDLGGIAKGFAVDQAVNTLQFHAPEISGCVNAGGDLRVFGEFEHEVLIRSHSVASRIKIRNSSVATSTVQMRDDSSFEGHQISQYLDLKQNQTLQSRNTAVVKAQKCMIADAFTKLALLMPKNELLALADQYQAQVALIE